MAYIGIDYVVNGIASMDNGTVALGIIALMAAYIDLVISFKEFQNK